MGKFTSGAMVNTPAKVEEDARGAGVTHCQIEQGWCSRGRGGGWVEKRSSSVMIIGLRGGKWGNIPLYSLSTVLMEGHWEPGCSIIIMKDVRWGESVLRSLARRPSQEVGLHRRSPPFSFLCFSQLVSRFSRSCSVWKRVETSWNEIQPSQLRVLNVWKSQRAKT